MFQGILFATCSQAQTLVPSVVRTGHSLGHGKVCPGPPSRRLSSAASRVLGVISPHNLMRACAHTHRPSFCIDGACMRALTGLKNTPCQLQRLPGLGHTARARAIIIPLESDDPTNAVDLTPDNLIDLVACPQTAGGSEDRNDEWRKRGEDDEEPAKRAAQSVARRKADRRN